MKNCPKCNELVGDTVETCFNCKYNFTLKRVITKEEIRIKREIQEQSIAKKNEQSERERKEKEALKIIFSLHESNLRSQRNITTGYNFEGYKIRSYLGLISGEAILGTGFLSEYMASLSDAFGVESNSFSQKLKSAKNSAIEYLINSCMEKGGNAIIGVNFDYITFNNNMMGVVANGTAVLIDKEP